MATHSLLPNITPYAIERAPSAIYFGSCESCGACAWSDMQCERCGEPQPRLCDFCCEEEETAFPHVHEFFVTREGASTRTADCLLEVFLSDVASLTTYEVPARFSLALLSSEWLHEENDIEDLYQEVNYVAESALSDAGLRVDWDDGYVIQRVIEPGALWIRILETAHTEDVSGLYSTECIGTIVGAENYAPIAYQPHGRELCGYEDVLEFLGPLARVGDEVGVIIDAGPSERDSVLVITIGELRKIAGGAL